MRRAIVILGAAAAFLAGACLAGGAGGDKNDRKELVAELQRQQQVLNGDLRKIASAISDIQEIKKTRDSGLYVLNDEEIKLEKQGKRDFHIFMERFRNSTLEVLQIYDRVLDKEEWRDPLRKVFGKRLDELVRVDWQECALDEIVDDLVQGYGVKMFIKGEVNQRRTMTLSGDYSLMSILLQIENVFHARLIDEEGELWFAKAPPPKEAAAEAAGTKDGE